MGRSVPLLSLLLLAACAGAAPAPPLPTPRLVAGGPAEVLTRLAPALAAQGLDARPGPGPSLPAVRLIAAGQARAAWADCPTVTFRDSESHVDLARPIARQMTLEIRIRPVPSGSEVEITARPEATYLNHFTNYTRSGPCSSTGVLEQQLLDAVGGRS